MISTLKRINSDFAVICLLTIFYLVGVWYGFPSTSIIFDEMFPGSVLRALSAWSLLPQGTDVLYGTVTYFLNYVFIVPVVIFVGLLNNLDINATKFFFIDSTWLVYLIARLISVASVVLIMLWTRDILIVTGSTTWRRIVIMVLTMSNLVVFTIFHTSKVWVVTCALIVGSLRYYLIALTQDKSRKNFLYAAFIFSAMATANFPLAGVFLVTMICWSVYLIHAKKINMSWQGFFKLVTVSGLVTIGIILLNWNGVAAQLKSIVFDYTLSDTAKATNLTISESFSANSIKLFLVAPIIILAHGLALFFRTKKQAILGINEGIKSFWQLVLISCVAYFGAIVVIARWSTSPEAYLRYMIPVCLLLGITLGIYVIAEKYVRVFTIMNTVLCLISIIFMFRSAWLLSVPTTYNVASHKVVSLYQDNNTVVVNNVSPLLSVRQSTSSYALNKLNVNYICGTRCKIVLDQNSDRLRLNKHHDFKGLFIEGYLVGSENVLQKGATAGGQVFVLNTQREGIPFSIGGGMELEDIGSYFSSSFWGLERLGKNIYSIRK